MSQTIPHCLTGVCEDSAKESVIEADDSIDLEETEPTVYSTPGERKITDFFKEAASGLTTETVEVNLSGNNPGRPGNCPIDD